MRRIAVGRVMLIAGLLCCPACRKKPETAAGSTFTFTTTFGAADGCPQSSTPNVANCTNGKPDCLTIHQGDRVKFRPARDPDDPKYDIVFAPSSKLATKTDPSLANDGKHWELVVAADTPLNTEHKFSVTSAKCPGKPLDPTIIIMP